MPIDFPSSPTVGQKYTYGNVTYTYTAQGIWNANEGPDFATAASVAASVATLQPLDADLTSLAAASLTNRLYYRSATDTWAPVTVGSNLTFSAGTLDGIAGGPAVAFRAHKNAVDQTGLTAASWQKLTFGFEDYDQGNFYDVATSRWTPRAGVMHIDARVYITTGQQAANWAQIAVFKNGLQVKTGLNLASAATEAVQISCDDVANGTDYYELYILPATTTTLTVSGAATYTFFSGHALSTAGPRGADGPPAPTGAMLPTGFNAWKNGVDQTLVGNAWAKVTFGTETYDYGSFYDPTQSRWTPSAGIVHIEASVYYTSGLGAGVGVDLGIYKNGVLLRHNQTLANFGVEGGQVSIDDIANGSDYYEVWATNGTQAGVVSGLSWTYFSGHLTGGPKGDTGPAAPIGSLSAAGFRAHKNTVDQTGLAGNVNNKITFTTEEYDYGNYYDAPNSRWIPQAGLVHIDATIYYGSGLTANSGINLFVYKNGVMLKHALSINTSTLNGVQISVDDIASGTDYYEVYELHATSTAVVSGVITDTFFNGHVTGGPKGDVGPAAPSGAVLPTGFRAHKNSVDQTGIANVTYTKVTFGFEDYDYGSYYDTGQSRWTPPAGLAHIDGVVFFNAGATANWYLGLCIYKNNLLYKIAFVSASAATNVSGTQISVDDVANGTDFYELYIYAAATAGVIDGRATYTYFSGHVTGGPKGDVGQIGPAGSSLAAPTAPQGRLTLQAGVPVMTTTTLGATIVRYTPSSAGDRIPLWDGTNWTMTGFTELSNDTTNTAKNPAAALPEAMYDMFVWNDSGTLRLSRGPPWLNTATVTISIATPAVINWNNHGLHEGSPVVFTTTGALPTGIVAGTIYYVSRSPTANTFNISTTIANSAPGNTLVASTMVNTSGTQSGVQTGINRDSIRGVGAGTTELVPVGGWKLNANAITNGPAAQRGTWVGNIRTNAAGTVDWRYGFPTGGGGSAAFYVWNAYNRVDVYTTTVDTVQNWVSYQAGTFEHNPGMRVNFISGFSEDAFEAEYACSMAASAGSYASSGIGYDQSNGYSGLPGAYFGASYLTCATTKFGATAIGAHFVTPSEGVISGSNTVYGYYTGSPNTVMGSAFHFRMRM